MRLVDQAIEAQKRGQLQEAETIYRKILAGEPRNFDALHMLGIVCAQNGKWSDAEQFFRVAIAVDPRYPPCLHNFGLFLVQQERYQEAITQFDQALALAPQYAPVHSDRGCALMQLGRLDESLASHDRAVALAPNVALAFYNRGNTRFRKQDYQAALQDYDQAVRLHPQYPGALYGRGDALKELRRYDAARAAYDQALALQPDFAEAWTGRGNVFYELRQIEAASADYDRALTLKPGLAEAWHGRANILFDLGRYPDAIDAYDKALASKPDFAAAWNGRGNALFLLNRIDEAVGAHDRAFRSNPDLPGLEGVRLHEKMSICDWQNLDAELAHLDASLKANPLRTVPFACIVTSGSPADQLRCARQWVARNCPPSAQPLWRGERYRHDRIRLGYVSTDFREHATSYLMAGMFERHDRARFEVTGVSLGQDDGSAMRARVRAAFDQFIDVAPQQSDDEIATLIRSREIDILVDLKGMTQHSRPGIFARRPAPIQVNYMGFAGSMGADFIDYLIADRIVIPDEHRSFYSEKIALLPDSYYVNDDRRVTADSTPAREQHGLPPTGFVFCCFNNNYKITPRVFDHWMRILRQTEGSVLWLLEGHPLSAANLSREAQARDVAPERLVFAKRLPIAEHLARHRHADLFIDTVPCNAHTTACDALWVGVPVLTCLGTSFCGRVAASVLHAIGLPELVMPDLQDYERAAIDLAEHPEKLSALKRKLLEHRATMPLFDTGRFTRQMETAFAIMQERHHAGLPPGHLTVAD